MRELDLLKRNECSCEKCRSFCLKTPGWFRPREIPRLAQYFNLTVKETFDRYLIADMYGENYVLAPVKRFDLIDKDEVLILRWIEEMRNINKKMGWDCDRAGTWTSVKYTMIGAPCIFHENDKCKIHPVKPFECSVIRHDITHNKIRILLAEEWKDSKLVKRLLSGNEAKTDLWSPLVDVEEND